MRSFVWIPILALAGACSADPVEPIADAHPPRNDVGPCGPTPVVFCLPGAIGRACGEGSVLMTCDGKFWACPPGTARPSDCGCRAGTTDAGADVAIGEACPTNDAGSDGDVDAD